MIKIGQATKTQTYRPKDFIDTYFKGSVIDIGGGGDPISKNVEVFDGLAADGKKVVLTSSLDKQELIMIDAILAKTKECAN